MTEAIFLNVLRLREREILCGSLRLPFLEVMIGAWPEQGIALLWLPGLSLGKHIRAGQEFYILPSTHSPVTYFFFFLKLIDTKEKQDTILQNKSMSLWCL